MRNFLVKQDGKMVKFVVQPIVRYCYRYLIIGLFFLFPMYVMFILPFDEVVHEEDRMYVGALGLLLAILGGIIINIAFLEKCFSVLILTQTEIRWKCPLRKSRVIPVPQCVEIGAYLESANKGIPSKQIYFSDHLYAQKHMGKNGVLKPSKHLIKFEYTEELCGYLLKNYPGKITGNLSYFHKQIRN